MDGMNFGKAQTVEISVLGTLPTEILISPSSANFSMGCSIEFQGKERDAKKIGFLYLFNRHVALSDVFFLVLFLRI